MGRLILIGIWVCAITLTSAYATASWLTRGPDGAAAAAQWEGLRYEKTPPINVPMIRNGKLNGYTVVQLVYTADSTQLKAMPVPPGLFVADEALRVLYGDDSIDLDHIQRYDLKSFAATVREKVNVRLESDVIRDVLVEQLSYFTREAMRP
jgi:hypothetical protein